MSESHRCSRADSCREAARKRRAVIRRAAIAIAAVALLAAPWPAGAAAQRSEDQRLVSRFFSPAHSHFGSTVAMDRFGDFALVGAPEGGSQGGGGVYHFQFLADTDWYNHTRSSASPTGSPQPFALDIEGILGIASLREIDEENSVLAFNYHGGLGALLQNLHPTEIRAVALQAEGTEFLALGHPDWSQERGLVWIFERNDDGDWGLTAGFQGVLPGERLGSSLAAKTGVLVAGSPGYGANGAVFIYVRGEEWIEWQRLDSPAESQLDAEFGAAVDIEAEGYWIAVGSPFVDRVTSPGERVDVGAVYLYENVGFAWEYETLLRPPGASHDDHFGASVALHDVVLVAGSPGEDGAVGDEGAAYVYQRSGSLWSTVPRLRLFDAEAEEHDALGTSVAAGDLGALVGAPYHDGNDVYDQGAVLFYRGIVTLFTDGFESGGTTAWSGTVP